MRGHPELCLHAISALERPACTRSLAANGCRRRCAMPASALDVRRFVELGHVCPRGGDELRKDVQAISRLYVATAVGAGDARSERLVVDTRQLQWFVGVFDPREHIRLQRVADDYLALFVDQVGTPKAWEI